VARLYWARPGLASQELPYTRERISLESRLDGPKPGTRFKNIDNLLEPKVLKQRLVNYLIEGA
jgi:hypothetical protein